MRCVSFVDPALRSRRRRMASRESILNLQEQERTDPEVAHRSLCAMQARSSSRCSYVCQAAFWVSHCW